MSEWKGPWKCEECGEVLSSPETPHMWRGGPYGYCKGITKPFDRRAPDPDLLEEEMCSRCCEHYLTVYRVPDKIWEQVSAQGKRHLLCPSCCDDLARHMGLDLYWEAASGEFPTVPLLALLREAREELGQYGAHTFAGLLARIDAALKEAGE